MNGTIHGPVLVLGATGAIGSGVVAAALARGHAVIAVGRDPARLQALRDRNPNAALQCLRGSLDGDSEGAALATQLRQLGQPLAGIVASLAAPVERGRVLDRPAAFLRRRLDEDLLPHLAAARHLLPVLAEGHRGGSYVLVGGPGSDYPWAGHGHRSIASAALQMLARVLHDEARALQLRVQLLAIDTPVCTDDDRKHACPEWPSTLAVGQRAMAMIERCDRGPAEAVVHFPPRDAKGLTSSELEDAASPPSSRTCTSERARRLLSQSLQQTRALLDSLAPSPSPSPPPPGASPAPECSGPERPERNPST